MFVQVDGIRATEYVLEVEVGIATSHEPLNTKSDPGDCAIPSKLLQAVRGSEHYLPPHVVDLLKFSTIG
jgi:hypothetical protein